MWLGVALAHASLHNHEAPHRQREEVQNAVIGFDQVVVRACFDAFKNLFRRGNSDLLYRWQHAVK